VVVLSNNDGCAIARSNEAKALGVKMGQPAFELKDLIRSGKLVALSGNHILYHDISVAVHNIFHRFAPQTIDYSVDEAFLILGGIPASALPEIGLAIHHACMTEEGIPVTVGFAQSKTLAKIATHIGKKNNQPVCMLRNQEEAAEAIRDLQIGELWGMGHRLARRMYLDGIYTAAQLAARPVGEIRKKYGMNVERTWLELHGTHCISLENKQRTMQDSISETRTFAEDISNYDFLQARIAHFANHCAAHLRRMNSGCKQVSVFLRTNRFRTDIAPQCPAIQLDLPSPLSSSSLIVEAALHGLKQIYDPATAYKRGGVLLSGIFPLQYRQPSLFDEEDMLQKKEIRLQPLMNRIDALNCTLSKPMVRLASQMGPGIPPKQDGFSSSFGFYKN